jgi:hypothetical protein
MEQLTVHRDGLTSEDNQFISGLNAFYRHLLFNAVLETNSKTRPQI